MPFIGGAELALKEITDRLGDFEFDLITARLNNLLPESEKINNVNVYRVGRGWRLDKFSLLFNGLNLALKLHLAKKYDMVFALMASYGGLTAARFKNKFNEVPFLVNIQEGRDFYHTSIWKLMIFKKIIRLADFITVISKYLEDVIMRNGVMREKISIIPNGVDINKFSSNPNYGEILKLKDKLGIRPDDKVIISVSRLVYKNGLDNLITAMKLLNENYKLLLIGDGEKMEELKELTDKLRISEKVIFLGAIDNKDLVQFFAISNVFVRPSRSEGLGTAFLEAMAAQIPVIATPVGGIIDFVKSAETGIFCAVDNPKSVAEKIKLLAEDKQLSEQIVKNAFKMVKEKYDWNKIAEGYREVFNRFMI